MADYAGWDESYTGVAVKNEGGEYKGSAEGYVWFDDPITGTTLAISEADFSQQAVREKLKASREAFGRELTVGNRKAGE